MSPNLAMINEDIVDEKDEENARTEKYSIDLVLWLLLILFLPLILFSIYLVSLPILTEPTPISASANISVSKTKIESENFEFEKRPLRLHELDKSTKAVCNDGSMGSYYLRKSESNSRKWLVFLEGGYFCHDTNSCQQRTLNSFTLTSSVNNKAFRHGTGILSSSSTENNHFHDVNAV